MYVCKVVVLGESKTGKTNILKQFVNNEFDQNSRVTIGVDFLSKEMSKQDIKLQFWDVAGLEKFSPIIPTVFKRCEATLFVYDVTQKETFSQISKWLELAKQKMQDNDSKFYLIANKIDLADRVVTKEEGEEFAKQNNMTYFEVSAKENINLDDLFKYVAEHIVKKQPEDRYGQPTKLDFHEMENLRDVNRDFMALYSENKNKSVWRANWGTYRQNAKTIIQQEVDKYPTEINRIRKEAKKYQALLFEHRDKTGLRGFFNRFRKTDSQKFIENLKPTR